MQRYRLAKWWLLEELRTLFLSSDPSEMVVRYTIKEPTTADTPSVDLQRSLLEQLASTKHILLKPLDDKTYEVTWQFEFESLYRKQQELVKDLQVQSGEKLEFDSDTGVLTLGTRKATIPPDTKEYDLWDAMYKRRVGETVDTSIIYEEMTGYEKLDETAKRMIKDAVRRINKRADELLGVPELIDRKNNTLRRIF